MLKEVYEFNKKRNGFKYDRELEAKMYNEEVEEFFVATTTAERMDALVDCCYVRYGTMFKRGHERLDINDLPYDKTVESLMISVLVEEIGQHMFDKVIPIAEEIVCKANAMKLIELDEDGKVMKQDDLPDATEQIGIMIENETRLQDMLENKRAKQQEEMMNEFDRV